MAHVETIFFATISLAVWTCFGQTPDVVQAARNPKDLERLLASGQPRDIAWAAFIIARESRHELAPNLAALLAAYQHRGPTEDRATVPPEDAAIEAVADALIQLQANLPAATVMHLSSVPGADNNPAFACIR